MYVSLNEEFLARAREVALQMLSSGERRLTIPLHRDSQPNEIGIIAYSVDGMLPLGQIEVGGKIFFIGLPVENGRR